MTKTKKKKDLLKFDTHGRPRTQEEIADLLADSNIAFDETGKLRTAEQIAAIKWQRVTEKPEVQELLREGLETYARIYNATRTDPTVLPSNLSYIAERLQYVRSQKDKLQTFSGAKEPVLVYGP